MEEHADGGDAGGSGGEALRGAGGGDAPEGEDGGRGREPAGLLESFQAERGRDLPAGDGLAEDGAEEDGVGALVAGVFDLGEGVAGAADEGCWEDLPDLGRGEVARGGGEMDAVGTGGEGDVRPGSDQNPCGCVGPAEGFNDGAGEGEQGGGGQILLADEEEIDAAGGECGRALEEFRERLGRGYAAG